MFSLERLREASTAPLASTPVDYRRPSSGVGGGNEDEEGGEELKINFITSLAYTLIPEVVREEAKAILSWALECKESHDGDEDILTALFQIEYFFAGTDNGHLFMFPLFPPSMRPFVENAQTREATAIPWNTGRRRLLHRHGHEEAVISVATLFSLVASAGSDAYVHLSIFHPEPRHVVSIPHPSPLTSLLLWEGAVFVASENDPERKTAISTAESPIVYMFTADKSGIVRMWRVNVDECTYFLSAVFIGSTHAECVGFASPLHFLACENVECKRTPMKQSKEIHCLAIDNDQRLLAGVKGGVIVWSLAALPWKQREEDHILCWDEEKREMNTFLSPTLEFRIRRLANFSMWVKSSELLRENICTREEDNDKSNKDDNVHTAVMQKSKWKPKYGTHVANGFDVGIVSNILLSSSSYSSAALSSLQSNQKEPARSLLRTTYAPLQFPSLKNTVYFPLYAVEPAYTPLHLLATAGNTCFALLVLQPGKRIVTSGSDGKVIVWLWDKTSELYYKGLISGETQSHKGLGRQLCLLRSPDIFVSCGYDDGLLKEWHVYDEPEVLMRCERRLKIFPVNSQAITGEGEEGEKGSIGGGISSAFSFPMFHALFIVGVFENIIQTFTLSEVQGCALPEDYVYDGYKTIRLATPSHTAGFPSC